MDRDENSNSDSGDIVAYLRSNNNGSKKRKRDIDGDADSTVGPKPKDREEIELENMLFGDTTIVNKLGKELKHAFGDADELKLDLGQHDDLLDEDEIPDEEDDSEVHNNINIIFLVATDNFLHFIDNPIAIIFLVRPIYLLSITN